MRFLPFLFLSQKSVDGQAFLGIIREWA